MNVSMHGKAIDYIELNPIWTQGGNPELVRASDRISLKMSATHHGDHDQFWVVVRDRDGVEIARYNARGLQYIHWSPPAHGDKS